MMKNNDEKKDEPKLTRLILANFKAFGRRQHIPIRPITLIYGRNNSGKSSLLHALLYARSLRGGPTPSVLQGGWSRLIHGRKETSIMEIGWDWENPNCESGLHYGKIINRFEESVSGGFRTQNQTCFAELNGQPLFDFTEQDDMFWEPEPHIDQKECNAALNHVQEWMASELDVIIKSSDSKSAMLRIAAATSSELRNWNFSDRIIRSLTQNQRGLKLGWDKGKLPPEFSFENNLEADFSERFSTAWYLKRFAGLHKGWISEEDPDPVLSGGLSNSLESHVENFVIERCAYLYFRWLESMWKNYTLPIAGLLDNLKYLPAIRERPDEILLREPKPNFRNKEEKSPFRGLPEWTADRTAILKAEIWLKEHKQLAGDIKLDFDELYSKSRRKGRDSKPSEGPVSLSLFDTVRKISLRFDEVGFGLSQFIPILLACYAKQKGYGPATGTLLIEEPEAHVHPAMQCELADVFIEATTREDHPLRNIICETHSEHLLLRLKRRIREGKIKPEHVAILYVENMGKESIVQEMPINEKGELIRDWPGGFFEDGLRELLE